MRVIQLIDGYKRGDGVGNAVAGIDDFLKKNGYDSAVVDRELTVSDLDSDRFKDAVVLYHFALRYDPLVEGLSCKKILVFHNITTPELFGNYNPESRLYCASSLYELKRTCDIFDMAIVFSEYSKNCLIDNGWKNDDILKIPIRIIFGDFNVGLNNSILKEYLNQGKNIVFMGRINPNKKDEDIIDCFAEYRENYEKDSKLFLVGAVQNKSYYESLIRYVERLGLSDAVHFTEYVSVSDYVTYYKIADLFLCMSEHEGFCIPLVEAMYFGIPIVAYDSTAVSDTLSDSGILIKNKNPLFVAEIINEILSSDSKKEEIVKKQRIHLREITNFNIEEKYRKAFEQIINTKRVKTTDRFNTRLDLRDCLDMSCFKPCKTAVIYGTGSSALKLYKQLSNSDNILKLVFCDKYKAGKKEGETDELIISVETLLCSFKTSNIIIAIQDKKIVREVAFMLIDNGFKKENIYVYDKVFNRIY